MPLFMPSDKLCNFSPHSFRPTPQFLHSTIRFPVFFPYIILHRSEQNVIRSCWPLSPVHSLETPLCGPFCADPVPDHSLICLSLFIFLFFCLNGKLLLPLLDRPTPSPSSPAFCVRIQHLSLNNFSPVRSRSEIHLQIFLVSFLRISVFLKYAFPTMGSSSPIVFVIPPFLTRLTATSSISAFSSPTKPLLFWSCFNPFQHY